MSEQAFYEADKTLFRDTVRKFLEAEIEPHYDEWEREEIWPREVWQKLGENGLLCVDMPEEYGGYGAPFEFSCVVAEEISRAGFGALSSGVSVHSDIVAPYILNLGTEEQRQRFLPKMAIGEYVGAIGMSEPAAGSDLQGIRTAAIKDGDDYVINGQKTFITNGQHCDVLVLATSNLSGAIDGAFLDRADLKLFIGPPGLRARDVALRAVARRRELAAARPGLRDRPERGRRGHPRARAVQRPVSSARPPRLHAQSYRSGPDGGQAGALCRRHAAPLPSATRRAGAQSRRPVPIRRRRLVPAARDDVGERAVHGLRALRLPGVLA